MDIIDLNSKYEPDFSTDKVQDNIKNIVKKHGNKFVLKNEATELPCVLNSVTEYSNNNLTYYSLKYNIDVVSNFLLPFCVLFIDYRQVELNNNCHITNIHRTNKVSGTNIMKTLLKFFNMLHINRVTLHDGTRIYCNNREMDLSFLKLLEKGMTFYQKFGFKICRDTLFWHRMEYKDDESFSEKLANNLDKFKKIQLKYIETAYKYILEILYTVIKDQNYENLKLLLYNHEGPRVLKNNYNNRSSVMKLVRDIDIILKLVKKSGRKYLYELMIDLFYNNCNDYVFIEEFIIDNMLDTVIYKNKKVVLEDIKIFTTIKYIRNSALFEYTYVYP